MQRGRSGRRGDVTRNAHQTAIIMNPTVGTGTHNPEPSGDPPARLSRHFVTFLALYHFSHFVVFSAPPWGKAAGGGTIYIRRTVGTRGDGSPRTSPAAIIKDPTGRSGIHNPEPSGTPPARLSRHFVTLLALYHFTHFFVFSSPPWGTAQGRVS